MPEIRLSNEPAERLQKGRSGLGINVEMPPESRNVGNSQGGNQYSMEHSMRSSMEVFKEYSMNVSKPGWLRFLEKRSLCGRREIF